MSADFFFQWHLFGSKLHAKDVTSSWAVLSSHKRKPWLYAALFIFSLIRQQYQQLCTTKLVQMINLNIQQTSPNLHNKFQCNSAEIFNAYVHNLWRIKKHCSCSCNDQLSILNYLILCFLIKLVFFLVQPVVIHLSCIYLYNMSIISINYGLSTHQLPLIFRQLDIFI